MLGFKFGSKKEMLGGTLSLKEAFRTFSYITLNNARDVNEFKPHGFIVFTGSQGDGKSLSAVQYVDRLHERYPKAIISTNMYLFDYFGLEELDVTKFTNDEKLSLNMKARCDFYKEQERLSLKEQVNERECFKKLDPFNFVYSSIKSDFNKTRLWVYEYNGIDSLQNLYNDEYGVIYFIDEFLTLYNSIKSKDMDLEDFEAICQLRKQHKRIVSCAQVFSRVAKGWREQVKEIVVCKNIAHILQRNQLVDGTTITDDTASKRVGYRPLKTYFWFHTVKRYKSYDTYQLVRKKKEVFSNARY